MKPLDSSQKAILNFLQDNQDTPLTLMDIGNEVGIDHGQKVLNKIEQLTNMGYIGKSPFGGYQVLREEEESEQIWLPFFGFAQCGNAGKHIFEEYPRRRFLLEDSNINPLEQDQYFITRAKGESMEPFIRSGDFLLVKVQKGYNSDDQVFIVHNGMPKVKKISSIGTQKFLQSYNPENRDLLLEKYDDTNIIGVVKKTYPKGTFAI